MISLLGSPVVIPWVILEFFWLWTCPWLLCRVRSRSAVTPSRGFLQQPFLNPALVVQCQSIWVEVSLSALLFHLSLWQLNVWDLLGWFLTLVLSILSPPCQRTDYLNLRETVGFLRHFSAFQAGLPTFGKHAVEPCGNEWLDGTGLFCETLGIFVLLVYMLLLNLLKSILVSPYPPWRWDSSSLATPPGKKPFLGLSSFMAWHFLEFSST